MSRPAASVTFASAPFDRAAQRLIATSKKSIEQNLREQGRLVVVEAAKITPPNQGKFNRKAGESAIRGDLNHIFVTLPASLYREFIDIFNGRSARRELRRKDGTVYLTDEDRVVSDLPAFHKSQRRRDGRVTSAGSRTRDIGRSRSWDRGVVTENQKRAYVAQVLARVGKLAAGWASAAASLGAKLPSWITRHSRPGFARFTLSGSRGTLEITNAGVYTGGNLRATIERKLQWVLRNRARNINRRVEYYLRRNATAAGFR